MNNRFYVHPAFCVCLCVALITLPIRWVMGWFVASAVHELGHFAALKALKIPVRRISLNLNGTYIETQCLSPSAELLCALAGPLVGSTCLFMSVNAPCLAVCAFVQSAYNLLPFPGFDGGRILKNILVLLLPNETAEKSYNCFVVVLSTVFLILGIVLGFGFKLGPIIFLICLSPVLKSVLIKIPCKEDKQIVQ